MEGEQVTITLDKNDLGQILDGIRCRAEGYRKTQEYYLSGGYIEDDEFIIFDCKDEHEAGAIALHYETIIANIEKQLKEKPNHTL